MGLLQDIAFETERRSILFHRNTSMPDGTQLTYDGDPNNANKDNSDGEFLLHYCPGGTRYLQKNVTPFQIWEKVADEVGGIWIKAGGKVIELPTNSDIGGDRAIGVEGGFAVYADSNTDIHCIGISKNAVVAGEVLSVQANNQMVISAAGFVSGDRVFVDNNGTLTQSPSGSKYTQSIGTAQDAEILLIDISQPIYK